MFDPAIDQATEQASEKDQVREFLDRTEIRTMRKDLQKMREALALQERERIIGLKPQMAAPAKKEVQAPQAPQTTPAAQPTMQSPSQTVPATGQASQNQNFFQQKETEEKEAIEQIKNYAQESEKQQIFYLEEQRMDLKKELEILEKQKEPPLLLEKNKLTLKRDDIQKKLRVLLEEEKKIENEEKLVSESEKTMSLPSDREKVEKKRWAIEEKRQESEKRNWAVEKELQTAEEELKIVDSECQKVVKEINEIKTKIAGINESLRSIYSAISTREQKRISQEKQRKDQESLKLAAQASKMKEQVMEQQWAGRQGTSGLSFLEKLPEDAKKQRLKQVLQGTSDEEQEQRRKFLENVEKWSEERDKNQDSAGNPPSAPDQRPQIRI